MFARTSFRLLPALLALHLVPALAAAAPEIHRVPQDYGTIQEAIDAADPWEIVEIADGTYTGAGNKDLVLGKQGVTIRSASGDPAACIIDCEGSGRGFELGFADHYTYIEGLTITNGAAAYGGGIYNSFAEDIYVTDCIISNCEASSEGGGIWSYYGTMNLYSSSLTHNEANSGGGAFVEGGHVGGSGCLFSGNTASGFGGGIVLLTANGYLSDYTIASCTAGSGHGGGAYLYDSVAEFNGCDIRNNEALGNKHGGGVCLAENSSADFIESLVRGNYASYRGGGVYAGAGSGAVFDRCQIRQNSAAQGGGLACETAGSITLLNCLVYNNECDYEGGAMQSVSGGTIHAANSTFVANTAQNGATLATIGGPATIYINNSIIWMAPNHFKNYDGSTIDISYSNVQGGWAGVGNISMAPLFVDAVGGDFRLAAGSPCIDAASNDLAPAELVDLAGALRFIEDFDTVNTGQGTAPIIDMGAFEYQRPAATLHVPGDYATIQEAIDLCIDGDTVLIADGTYTGAGNTNLDFGGRAILVAGASGDRTACIIDCEGTSQGFIFDDEEGSDSIVRALTIRNGNAPSLGGGIECTDASPKIQNCVIEDCYASEGGGGIGGKSSSETVISCLIRNNTSTFGGGVASAYGSPTYTNCVMSGNTGTLSGGGAKFHYSAPTLNACTLSGNMTPYDGGGIYSTASHPTITGGSLHHNVCENQGGAIFIDQTSTAAITDVTINNNTATIGGGVFCNDNQYSVVLDGCTIRDNLAHAGGGVYGEYSSPTLINCSITGHHSTEGGGAFFVGGAPTLTDCNISNNSAVVSGGGLHVYESEVAFNGCTISNNTLQGTSPYDGGAGVYCLGTISSFDNCTIENNVITDMGEGGGVCIRTQGRLLSQVTMTDTVISNNTARGDGGGIYDASNDGTVLNGCMLSGNSAGEEERGGGYYGSSALLQQCVLLYNSAGAGGGADVYDTTFIDCEIAHNLAGFNGGVRAGSDTSFINCKINDNDASVNGGGAGTYGNQISFINCEIARNSAGNIGGGFFADGAALTLVSNCTVVFNTANNGQAISCKGGSVEIENSIIWVGSSLLHGYSGGTITAEYSDIQGGWPGTGNFNLAPLFVDAPGGDYRPSAISPCIDAGNNDAVPHDSQDLDGDDNFGEALPYDLAGHARFVDDPDTADTGNGAPPLVDVGAYELRVHDGPYIGDLDADPSSVLIGERLNITGYLGGDCSLAQFVVFYIVPGDDCDFANAVWYKWIATNGECEAATQPISQLDWADDTDTFTVVARVYWTDYFGQTHFSDTTCVQRTLDNGEPRIDDLTASPKPVQPGARATLTAHLGGFCDMADFVIFTVIPGIDCDLSHNVWNKWVATGGACQVSTHPVAQANWDDGSGYYTVVARAYWQDGNGNHFSEPVCVQSGIGNANPFIDDLTATPDPVEVGERLMVSAGIWGNCAKADYVVFNVIPGDNCDLNNSVWSKWVPSDGVCGAEMNPLVQEAWDDGSGQFTLVARAYWSDNSGPHFSSPVCAPVDITAGDPFVDSFDTDVTHVAVGKRFPITAILGGECAQADYVVFNIVPGESVDLANSVWSKWQATNGSCTTTVNPLVQANWHDADGIATLVARTYWQDDDGGHFSDKHAVPFPIDAHISSLTAAPDPVNVGQRVTLSAALSGYVPYCDYVVFYVIPGADCDISHNVWSKWVATDGQPYAETYPIVQGGWDDGSGTFTVVARPRNTLGGNHFGAKVCIQTTIGGRAAPGVLYVDADAEPNGDGAAWHSAMNDLQQALALAADPDRLISEIWVAEGTYRPDQAAGDRTRSFELVEGVTLYGGFSGKESERNERDPVACPTILSGDLNGDDDGDPGNRADNAYHIVRAENLGAPARLDGFTVTGGHADGANEFGEGAGARIVNAEVLLVNCVFADNQAAYMGGAVRLAGKSAARLIDVTCRRNFALYGGAIASDSTLPVELSNCLIVGNTATMWGGGLYSTGPASLHHCTIVGNGAAGIGGGVYTAASADQPLVISASILWSNSDAQGSGEAAQIATGSAYALLRDCCIQGWSGVMPGENCSGDDPLFVDADGPDGIFGTDDDDLHLQETSPCLDAANAAHLPPDAADLDGDGDVEEPLPLDLAGERRICDSADGAEGLPDLGVYEAHCLSSPGCVGDVNGDGLVDQADLALLLASYDKDDGGDVDGDGDTDQADLGALLTDFGCGT